MPPAHITLILDRENHISRVSGPWDEFARTNGAPHLLAEKVLGSHFLRHITGGETRLHVMALLEAARFHRAPLSYTCRCDSPGERRYLQTSIIPRRHDALELRYRVVAALPRFLPFDYQFQHDIGLDGLRFCSLCNRFDINDWQEGEEAEASWLIETGKVRAIPVLCDDCATAGQPLTFLERVA